MTGRRFRLAALAVSALLLVPVAACSNEPVSALSSIGARGTGDGAYTITARVPSAAGLVRNAPVMLHDTTVGSVGDITIKDWSAELTLRLEKGVKVPTGSHAMIGMTSVLGSSHIEIVPPEHPTGSYLAAGGGLALPNCPDQQNIAAPAAKPVPDINAAQQVDPCMYPTTEQVLSSLSVVLNGGGLSQVGDVVHELSQVFGGHDDELRTLVPRLNTLVSDLDAQTGNIISAMSGLDRLTAAINAQTPTVERALQSGPEILQLLVDQRKNLTTALGNVGDLSSTVNAVLDKNSDDIKSIVPDLRKLLEQLSQTGPALANSLRILLTFPFLEENIPTVVKGDYVNSDLVLDLTWSRLNKTMVASVTTGPEAVFGKPAAGAKRGTDPFRTPLVPGPTTTEKKDPANPKPSTSAPVRPATPSTKNGAN
ncbi:MlaD family protein [Gordonia humi]|uniref:Phospholipid/cholesterol/gamma-HCH transport system substrate-binding protein n=1 Tax=Gordonia humi TaxID=686429 RepID=A0A840ESJ5_9ACTN|nr:MlaD family protein [Gordonia humi]MBB4134531.1 phospholipid/cholesterol/gamma-HCH transport system substrate-binding protein [Gordonia humi]